MHRIHVLLALTVAALVALGVVLVISAADAPLPPTAAPPPRDDQQSQPQQAQSEPEPEPESEPADDGAQQQAAQQTEQSEPAEQEESQPAGQPVADEQLPTTRLIAALKLDQRTPPPPAADAPATRQHTIAAGDSLSSIARAYGVEIQQLVQANDLDRSAPLRVGDTLQIAPLRTYIPLQTPPGPTPYAGGGLIWGTIADAQSETVHTAVVSFVDHRAGLPGAPDLLIGCIHDRLVVELFWRSASPEPAPDALRLYWRANDGPLQTSRWTLHDGVLTAPDPHAFIDALHDVRDFHLYLAAPDTLFISYWYPNLGHIVETPLQPNLDHCGR